MESTNTQTSESKINQDAKQIAMISYITIIGLIIAYVMNNDKNFEYAKYHIIQSLGLTTTGVALGIVGFIPILGWILNIIGAFILIYMWVVGLMNALNEKKKPVPFLGKKYEEWFAKI